MSVQELYDQAAHRYDDIVEKTNYFGPVWLNRELDRTKKPERILDLGCATGTLGVVLKQAYPGAEITGVDISPRMIELADKRGCYSGVLVRDLNEALAFSDDSFDLVVALGFMEFLEDPISTLKEVNRVLKPGGTVLVSFQEHWLDKPELAPRTTRSGVVSHHAYTLEESIDLLKTSGMEVISAISEIGYTSSAGFSCPYVFCKGEATR